MKKSIRRFIAAFSTLLALPVVFAPQIASADTANDDVDVSASVTAFCVINASALDFGVYTNTQKDAASTIDVTCTIGTSWTLALDAGDGSGATTSVRRMTGGTPEGTLDYALYSDAGRTTIWGSNTGVDTVAGSGTGSAQTQNVYGRIPASQFAAVGSYDDIVTATLTY